ncbi:hypothetical protein NKH77_21640 [Streptomyces sp. M19]
MGRRALRPARARPGVDDETGHAADGGPRLPAPERRLPRRGLPERGLPGAEPGSRHGVPATAVPRTAGPPRAANGAGPRGYCAGRPSRWPY